MTHPSDPKVTFVTRAQDDPLTMDSPVCGGCGTNCQPFDSGVVLGHIEVQYFRCPQCGLVRTEDPTWLDEAYSTPIASMDVGLLGRCLALADVTEAVVRTLSLRSRGLDWAGGYGVLTRLLRDRGLDFYHFDPYTKNIFAAGLEGDPAEKWDVVTLFEVLEHLTDPITDLAPLCAASPVLLFTTEVLPDPAPRVGSWWYYALEGGQHVAFYTMASLAALADRLDRELVSDGRSIHALCVKGALPRQTREVIQRRRLSRRLLPLLRKTRPTVSLLQDDFETARLAAGTGGTAPD